MRNGSSFSSIFSKPRGIPKILQHKNHKTTTTNTQKPTTETIHTTSTTTTMSRITADLTPATQKESTPEPTTPTQSISTPTTTEHTTITPRTTEHTTTTRTTTTEPTTTRRITTPTTTSTAATSTSTSAINTFESYPSKSEAKISDDIINTDYYDEIPENSEKDKSIPEIPVNNENIANSRSVSSFGSFVLPSRGGNPYSYRNLKPVGIKATAFNNEDLQIVFDMKKEPQLKHFDYDMIFNEASNLNSERNYYSKPTVDRGPAFIYQNSEKQHRPINRNVFERRNENFSIIYDNFPMKNRRLRRYRNEDYRNY